MSISVICVYNDDNVLKDQLLLSLDKFSVKKYELILLDSRKYGFKSSAEGLNYGARIAKGDVLIFTHQDIYLKDEKEFYEFAEYIQKRPCGDIVGAAGAIEKNKNNFTNYTTGLVLNNEKTYNYSYIQEVACVDESFFGMSKDTYVKHPFDQKLCNDWHLYAVEASMFARKNGCRVIVFPLQIHHYSNGTISIRYMKELLQIADVYRTNFKYIWTTCYKVRSSWLYTRSLFIIWYLHRVAVGKSVK